MQSIQSPQSSGDAGQRVVGVDMQSGSAGAGAAADQEVQGFGASGTERGHVPSCFVVDEDPKIRHFLSLILHGEGVSTEEFSDGASFLDAVDHRPPDLVFIDVGRDSSEAIQLIEGLSKKGHFGFVQLMSSHGAAVLEHVRKTVEQKGLLTLPVLQKPFQTDAVVNIVRTLKLTDAEEPASRFGLDEALAGSWLEYCYQPKIDLRKKRLIGAEVFVRARHPKFGAVSPALFMPGASDEDLVALGKHSVNNVIGATGRFAAIGLHLRLAINMSLKTLKKLDVAEIVRAHHTPAETCPGFIIDIPEEQVLKDFADAAEVAKSLRPFNVSLAIDDCGHGYTSLMRLKALPFEEIKLGRAFVADCGVDKSRAPLCRTLIGLAHKFERVTVAVGLEKASEVTALVTMGCDYAQGHLLGRPMPENRFLSLLRLRTDPQKVQQLHQSAS